MSGLMMMLFLIMMTGGKASPNLVQAVIEQRKQTYERWKSLVDFASTTLVTGYFYPTRLYFNRGDGTFEQSAEVNAMFAGSACSVAAAADYDNDGWTDVYIGCRGQSNLLMRNLGGRRFVNAMVPELDHAPAGANPPHTDALAWGDLDGNGLLDIYIGVYPDSASPDVTNPDNLDRVVLQTAPNTWTNITAEFSLEQRQKLRRPVLAAVISDLDQDGLVDILYYYSSVKYLRALPGGGFEAPVSLGSSLAFYAGDAGDVAARVHQAHAASINEVGA